MIPRRDHEVALIRLLRRYPVVALIGARQIGKSTLAHAVADSMGGQVTFFDLENPRDLARMGEPMLALESLRGLVILDEVQRRPELFAVLRVLADRKPAPARFLVLGSASGDLLRQSSESLAGRIAYYQLDGLSLAETGAKALSRLWLRGSYPKSFTARSEKESLHWRSELVRAYVERDLPSLGTRVSSTAMWRFWMMIAHFHGQIWNAAELARSCGVNERTVRHHLDLLTSTFMVRQLQPWHENIAKRQIKSPKIYVADSGLLHQLLNVETSHELMGHGKVGASWKGFALQQLTIRLGVSEHERFFWALHTGAELDLLIVRGRERLGFEVKLTDSPKVTPSMHSALQALGLKRIDVLCRGEHVFSMGEQIRAVPVQFLWDPTLKF